LSGNGHRRSTELIAGLKVWFDKDDLKPGTPFSSQIAAAIQDEATAFVVYVGTSEQAMDRRTSGGRLDQEPMITCRYQPRIALSLAFRQTVTLGRAMVQGRKSATVML
jgi:hypothetical protein